MQGGWLLDIEPHELIFRFELHREAFCQIRLINNWGHHVAFKMFTTNPDKYFGRPNIGVLSPRSTCHVLVTMLGPVEVPFDMQCYDYVLIQSFVARPGTTAESAQKLFTKGRCDFDIRRLRVVYDVPQDQVVRQQQHNEDWVHLDGFTKTIALVLILFIFRHLMLPLIWSTTLLIVVWVTKAANNLFQTSLEDWIVKVLGYLIIYFFTALFQRGGL